MKKKIYSLMLCCLSVLIGLSSCDLELQKNYDYESSVADPHVKMTAWEYFQQNKANFSELISAIELTGMQQYYTQTDKLYTYLALNNTAMQKYRENQFPGTASISECDAEMVAKLLKYHIIDGEYSSYSQLQTEAMFVLTLLPGEEGLMTMTVWKNPWQAAVGKILVNETGSNGSSPQRKALTSNIMPVNGIIHIFEDYCYYKR